MPHIHEKYDFVVGVFVVHKSRVCMIKHRALGVWLQPGGHIELDEVPDAAAVREFGEEVGLKITLLGNKPLLIDPTTLPQTQPRWVDVHPITPEHKHICFYYLGVLNSGLAGLPELACEDSDKLPEYSPQDHTMEWMDASRIASLPQKDIRPATRYYALRSIEELGELS